MILFIFWKSNKQKKIMVINIIYSIILPVIGLLVVSFILLYGVKFSSSKESIPDDATWKYILSQPLRECPLWIWAIVVLVFQTFIIHTIMLWNSSLAPTIPQISDLIAFSVLILYMILIGITDGNGKFRKIK